jgi:hypothetical protein
MISKSSTEEVLPDRQANLVVLLVGDMLTVERKADEIRALWMETCDVKWKLMRSLNFFTMEEDPIKFPMGYWCVPNSTTLCPNNNSESGIFATN